MNTSLIIPVYATTQDSVNMTRECLKSLKYGRPDEVISVDDGSPMPLPVLHQESDQVIRHPENYGYIRAVNTGLAKAHGDVLILGNSDIIFSPGWLEGILKPLDEGYDIASIIASDQGYSELEDKITSDDRFGCLWAMKRAVYEALGGQDESLGRHYFGDTDYHMRAKEAGFRVGKYWGALVEHKGGGTIKVVDPNNEDYEQAKDRFRAKWGFII